MNDMLSDAAQISFATNQLVLGYLMLHEFNCAHGSSKSQSAGSISIRP